MSGVLDRRMDWVYLFHFILLYFVLLLLVAWLVLLQRDAAGPGPSGWNGRKRAALEAIGTALRDASHLVKTVEATNGTEDALQSVSL